MEKKVKKAKIITFCIVATSFATQIVFKILSFAIGRLKFRTDIGLTSKPHNFPAFYSASPPNLPGAQGVKAVHGEEIPPSAL